MWLVSFNFFFVFGPNYWRTQWEIPRSKSGGQAVRSPELYLCARWDTFQVEVTEKPTPLAEAGQGIQREGGDLCGLVKTWLCFSKVPSSAFSMRGLCPHTGSQVAAANLVCVMTSKEEGERSPLGILHRQGRAPARPSCSSNTRCWLLRVPALSP